MSASAATLRRQAIERAQAAARAEYLQARADTEARVLDLLDLLADDVSAYLVDLANPDGELPADAQVLLEAYLSQRLQAFAAAWQAELGGLLEQAARIGAGIAAEGSAAVSIAQQAQLFLQQFVAADGLQLSDRLWRLTTGTQADLVDLLRTTIASGADAARTADALLASGRSVPAELIAQRNAARATSLGRAVRNALTEDGAANARFNLIRLLRTEGNRSYTEAYVGSLATVEGIAGVKFTLSPLHPRPDVCDLHAAANLHGMGPGVYPLNRHPYPAHPMTLSYLQPVFVDEITDDDRAGQQSAFEWIRTQPADLQDAVLGGQRKGTAFRAGELSPADLRTPWREIEGRG